MLSKTITMHPLKTLLCTASGILGKAREVELFEHNINTDIILLSEIRLYIGLPKK